MKKIFEALILSIALFSSDSFCAKQVEEQKKEIIKMLEEKNKMLKKEILDLTEKVTDKDIEKECEKNFDKKHAENHPDKKPIFELCFSDKSRESRASVFADMQQFLTQGRISKDLLFEVACERIAPIFLSELKNKHKIGSKKQFGAKLRRALEEEDKCFLRHSDAIIFVTNVIIDYLVCIYDELSYRAEAI